MMCPASTLCTASIIKLDGCRCCSSLKSQWIQPSLENNSGHYTNLQPCRQFPVCMWMPCLERAREEAHLR